MNNYIVENWVMSWWLTRLPPSFPPSVLYVKCLNSFFSVGMCDLICLWSNMFARSRCKTWFDGFKPSFHKSDKQVYHPLGASNFTYCLYLNLKQSRKLTELCTCYFLYFFNIFCIEILFFTFIHKTCITLYSQCISRRVGRSVSRTEKRF